MRKVEYGMLSKTEKSAVDEALRVSNAAYNPYSHFAVGACLYTKNGVLISGANVENAAYGSTLCAERSAILTANAKGLRHFAGIALVGRAEKFETTKITSPCGSCRQMLFELSLLSGYGNLDVVLSNPKNDVIITTTITQLLPLAFGPLDLGIDISRYRV